VKVAELIKKLQQMDPGLDIYCYEEGPVPMAGGDPGPFDIVDVSQTHVTASRNSTTNKAAFKFEGNEKGARMVAIIGITPDF
jgi:hypothetical protein